MPDDNLPEFQAGKLYLLRAETLEALKRAIRTNQPKAVTGSGITVDDHGDAGQFIGAQILPAEPPAT